MGIRKHFGWLNADIGRSLALSALGTIMLGVGYSGWVGEWWAKENHDRVSWFILLSGLALAGFHFLGDRAERIGSERARKHFIAATIVLGILVVAMLVGCAALTSLMVGVVIGLFVLPWFQQASLGLDEPLIIVVAGIVFAAMVVSAVVEFAYRHYSRKLGLEDQGEPFYILAMPVLTLSIGGSLFLSAFAAIALVGGLGMLLLALGSSAALFPEGLGQMFVWLAQHKSIKWALPVCLVMIAAIGGLHLYRRARWNGPAWRTPPRILDAFWSVFAVCIVLNVVSLAVAIALLAGRPG